MSETLLVDKAAPKSERYEQMIQQLQLLLENETDSIALLANISAGIVECFGHLWVGFYLVKHNELVLGPFQGPIACTRIQKGRGVCGSAWDKANTIVVPDVDKFEGHIACSSDSRSEIVVPIFTKSKDVFGVLDVDSDTINTFDNVDQHYLEILTTWIGNKLD